MSDSDSWSVISEVGSDYESNLSPDEDFERVGKDEKRPRGTSAPMVAPKESAAQYQYPTRLSSSRQHAAMQPDPNQIHKLFGVPMMAMENHVLRTGPVSKKYGASPPNPSNSLKIGRNLAEGGASTLSSSGGHVRSRQNSSDDAMEYSDDDSVEIDKEKLQKYKEKVERRRARALARATKIGTPKQVSETEHSIPRSSMSKGKVRSHTRNQAMLSGL